MTTTPHRGLQIITGPARLPGDYAPVTDAEQRHQIQFHPGPVAQVVRGASDIRLELPWPPSINSYWQLGVHPGTKKRMLKMSAEGKRFNRDAKHAVRQQFDAAPIAIRVAVLIEAWAPIRGPYGNDGWDVDNRVKPTLDALTKAGLWTDDCLVRDVRIVDRGRCDHGRLLVYVRPLERRP